MTIESISDNQTEEERLSELTREGRELHLEWDSLVSELTASAPGRLREEKQARLQTLAARMAEVERQLLQHLMET